MPLSAVIAFLAALVGVGAPAVGDVVVEAGFELGPPPAWQDADERRVEGSWVRHSSPVLADLDPPNGNGPEVVVGSVDGKVYALRTSEGELEALWARDVGTYVDSSPAVADLDGDGFREVLVGAGNTNRTHNSGVHVFARDGGQHRHWATPDVPGFSNGVFSTPAVGDVTGDGRPEVVYGSFNHHMYVKDASGADLPGWEGGKFMHDTVWSSASLADLDGDGDREIVIGSDLGGGASVFGCPGPARGMVSIFEADGGSLDGWPKCTDTPIWSSPSVADVTGDGILDVIVGTNNYRENGGNVGEPWKVRAWSSDGSPLWTASLEPGARIFASPAVGDVTGDGRPEVAVATIEGNVSGRVWLLDAVTGRVLWGRSDGGDDSCCIFMGSPILADVSGDGRADVVAAGGDGALHAWDGGGERLFHLGLGRTFFNSPAAGDVDGDGRPELVAASAAGGSDPSRGKVWTVASDGVGEAPWSMFRRDPTRLGAVGSGRLPGTGAPSSGPTSPPNPTTAPATPAAPGGPSDPTSAPDPTATPDPAATSEATGTPGATRTPSATSGTEATPESTVAALGGDRGPGRGPAPWAGVAVFVAALGTAVASRRLGLL